MNRALSPTPEASKSIEKRFLALNSDRLARARGNLSPRQCDFLDLLPLLFHINHPLLPGYLSKNAASGIRDYTPAARALNAARRVCRSFSFEQRSALNYAVRGLYLMGSPGTIAYSRESDLDFWLLHGSDLTAAAIAELGERAARIERYAATLALEVHFFVFDVERFRNGENLSLSAESSGSSQHYLLLDEFYRASLLLAGQRPLWWRVPSAFDCDYEGYVEAAIQQRHFDARDYLDFGGLTRVPAEEFFGAAVWQLHKSIESPYKSVLKLLLMEAYAASYPELSLLSLRFKANLESDESDLNALDPYILMYRKVEEYLLTNGDSLRLDVLRRSFYLKVNLPLSAQERSTNADWRRDLIATMVESWQWTPARIAHLDQRNVWRIDAAIDERRDLVNTLKDSYAALSQFARGYPMDQTITERDLNRLGRSLYAAFEKKPSKIEVLGRGFCANPSETSLSLHQMKTADNSMLWVLFSGLVKPTEISLKRPLKRSSAAVEIIVWCHLNRLTTAATTWHVFSVASALNSIEIKRISDALDNCLAPLNRACDLEVRERITRLLLLVNVGVDAAASPLVPGQVLMTNHTDAFHFGGQRSSLLRSIDMIFTTSWSETFVFHYEGHAALLEALAECMQWAPFDGSGSDLPSIETRCFTSDHAAQVAARVNETMLDASRFVARTGATANPHFILEIEQRLQHLHRRAGKAVVVDHGSQVMLIKALGEAEGEDFNDVHFDRGCRLCGLLPRIYAENRPGHIQIFAHRIEQRANVYVLDECGRLLVQFQDCYEMKQLLDHYRRFLMNALPRCVGYGRAGYAEIGVETMEIVTKPGQLQLKAHQGAAVYPSPDLSLQILADADANGSQQFTIHTNEREFSTWEHGSSLFTEVAHYVVAKRRSHEHYPIYITDLALSTRFREVVGVQTLRPFDLLGYKKRIEHQLTRAIVSDVVMQVALAT